jgi:hypothetical protein
MRDYSVNQGNKEGTNMKILRKRHTLPVRTYRWQVMGTVLALVWGYFPSSAQAQVLSLRTVMFVNRILTLTSSVQGLPLYGSCSFKIRASPIRKQLLSSGLGTLLFEFQDPSREQIEQAGLIFLTDPLREVPISSRVYFRSYLDCDTFDLKSEIRSYSFLASRRLRLVSNRRFLRHIVERTDTF